VQYLNFRKNVTVIFWNLLLIRRPPAEVALYTKRIKYSWEKEVGGFITERNVDFSSGNDWIELTVSNRSVS
jgi:hypothetical protein